MLQSTRQKLTLVQRPLTISQAFNEGQKERDLWDYRMLWDLDMLRGKMQQDALDVCDKGKRVKKDPRIGTTWRETVSMVMERGEGQSSDNGPMPTTHISSKLSLRDNREAGSHPQLEDF